MLATTALLSLLLLTPATQTDAGSHATTVATTTTLQIEQHGAASRVLVHVDVLEGAARAEGTVTVLDGDRVLARVPVRDGRAELTTNLPLDGGHVLSADFGAHQRFGGSRSGRRAVGTPVAPVRGNVTVTIPAGMLTLTSATREVAMTRDRVTGHGRGSAADDATASGATRVVVTDTRAGNMGFAVQVTVDTGRASVPPATPRRRAGASLCALEAVRLPGNALRPADVRVRRGCVATSARATVATYPAGIGIGTLDLRGRVVVPGDAGVAHLTWTVI